MGSVQRVGLSAPRVFAVMLGCLSLLACSGDMDADRVAVDREEGLVVGVTTYPLAYFAERLVGDKGRVLFPLPEGVAADGWSPGVDDLQELQSADVVFINGSGLESWLARSSLPRSRLVNTARGFADQHLVIKDAIVHHHGDGRVHAHDGVDPHFWLDPDQAGAMARAMYLRLLLPMRDHAEELKEDHEALQADLRELGEALESAADPLRGSTVPASHPVYDYLGRRFGFELSSMHLDPQIALTGEQWEELDQLIADGAVRLMLWDDEPLPETLAGLGERGIVPVVFNPGMTTPAQEGFLEMMHGNAQRLATAAGLALPPAGPD